MASEETAPLIGSGGGGRGGDDGEDEGRPAARGAWRQHRSLGAAALALALALVAVLGRRALDPLHRLARGLEARGYRVLAAGGAPLVHAPGGRVRRLGRLRGDDEALGPSARDALGARARAALARAVLARGARPPLGRCPAAVGAPIEGAPPSHSLGEGDVALLAGEGGAVELLPQGKWGSYVHRRRACAFSSSFDAGRAACAAPGPLAVLWYAPPPADAPADAPARAARSLSEVACVNEQCRWLRRGLRGARPLARLVGAPDEACVFVLGHEALHARGADAAACRPGAPCVRPFAAAAAHWSAAGAPGRNHLLVQPQCAFRCDLPGEMRQLGSAGEALIASAASWHGLYRPGHDVQLAMPWTEAMSRLARDAPQEGWWAQGKGGDGGDEARPLLLTFRGSVSGGSRWATSRVDASEWSHEPRARVFVSAVDKYARKKPRCGSSAQPDWAADARAAGAGAATVAAAGAAAYHAVLVNSSFGFAPGGSGPYSFRFTELLAAGAVPVVPEDLVLPWADGLHRPLDWAACVVRVSRAEVRALGDVVLALAPDGSAARRARRAACARVWEALAGLGPNSGGRPPDPRPRAGAADAAAHAHAAYNCAAAARVWLELGARIARARGAPRARADADDDGGWGAACSAGVGRRWAAAAAPSAASGAWYERLLARLCGVLGC